MNCRFNSDEGIGRKPSVLFQLSLRVAELVKSFESRREFPKVLTTSTTVSELVGVCMLTNKVADLHANYRRLSTNSWYVCCFQLLS